jgi:hypothetical protein
MEEIKLEEKPKRTVEMIKQEYLQTASAYGNLLYKIRLDNQQAEEIFKKMLDLNNEGFAVQGENNVESK